MKEGEARELERDREEREAEELEEKPKARFDLLF